MNINEIKSNLKMENFHFSELSIKRSSQVDNGEYNIDLNKNIESIGEHAYNVTLVLTIEKEDLNLSVTAKAKFIYEATDYSNEEQLLNKNTVAIMFPFIRSQVSLLTTQPGMAPIILPTINTARFE